MLRYVSHIFSDPITKEAEMWKYHRVTSIILVHDGAGLVFA
jgi:hypothetical protein